MAEYSSLEWRGGLLEALRESGIVDAFGNRAEGVYGCVHEGVYGHSGDMARHQGDDRHDRESAMPSAASSSSRHVSVGGSAGVSVGGQDIVEEVRKISSVEELEDRVRQFDGIDLKKTAMNTVFARGNPRASLMLIGEAPGNEEDRQGKPFVGESGMLLDKILYWAGFDVARDCYISNMLFWRPPGNRAPSSEEIALCRPFVERHIALVKPKIVLFVGGIAAKNLLNSNQGITQLRQGWHEYRSSFLDGHGIVAKAIFHPAYLLRAPGNKRFVWRDMIDVREKIESMETMET